MTSRSLYSGMNHSFSHFPELTVAHNYSPSQTLSSTEGSCYASSYGHFQGDTWGGYEDFKHLPQFNYLGGVIPAPEYLIRLADASFAAL